MKTKSSGFTLIELLITVAIVGILATIALPNYFSYMARSSRADAKTALLMNAQFLERNFTEANRYDKDSGGNPVTLPYTQSPSTGAAQYTLTLVATITTYTLTATPVDGSSMDGDACDALSINHIGQKTVGAGATLSAGNCWNR